MKRHWLGVGLVLLAVVTAAVLPNIDGRPIAGQAQAVPVDGPPRVGDCLLEPVPGFEVAYDSNGLPRYVTGRIEPCTKSRFGEVAGTLTGPLPLNQSEPEPGTTPGSSIQQQCAISYLNYLGATVDTATMLLRPEFTYWTPMINADVTFYAPTPRQRAAGQAWMACVVHPGFAFREAQPPYDRSPRDGGPLPGPFGACASMYSEPDGWMPAACDGPHPIELIGMTAGPEDLEGVTQRDLDATCRSLAARRTGIPNLSSHDGLKVSAPAQHTAADAMDVAEEGLGDEGTLNRHAACIITATGSRELAGSLVGLGDRPIPWT